MRGCIRLEKPKAAGWGPMEKAPVAFFIVSSFFNANGIPQKWTQRVSFKLKPSCRTRGRRTSPEHPSDHLWQACGIGNGVVFLHFEWPEGFLMVLVSTSPTSPSIRNIDAPLKLRAYNLQSTRFGVVLHRILAMIELFLRPLKSLAFT